MIIIKEKRSQAALEFLTTYGWAFLVILIMISVLAYFGILSPSKLLPSRCNFGAEFQCADYQVSATANTFKLRLRNSVGEVIDVSSISLGSESASAQYNCTTSPANPTLWNVGQFKDLTWSNCNSAAVGFIAGQRGKVLVAIIYNIATNPGYSREVKGEIYTAVV